MRLVIVWQCPVCGWMEESEFDGESGTFGPACDDAALGPLSRDPHEGEEVLMKPIFFKEIAE